MARPHLRDVVSVPRTRRGALGIAVGLVGPFAALAVASLDGLARFRGTPFLIVIIVASALGRLAGALKAQPAELPRRLPLEPPAKTLRHRRA